MSVCLLLVIALCLGRMAAQTGAAEKRFSLQGEIVDGLTGRPVTDSELTLQTAEWEPTGEPVTPDRQGRFVFRQLAAGLYILGASRDMGTVFFGELPEPGTVRVIRVGPDDEDKFVRFRLIPRSLVTGIVRDEFGDPVLGANVILLQPVWRDGQTTLEQFNLAATDDRGHYRIGNVRPGGYRICADFCGAVPAPTSGLVDFAARGEPRFYTRSCYGGSRPATLRLASGQRADLDLTLRTTSAVWVRGRLLNLPPLPPNLVPAIRLTLQDPFDAVRQQMALNFDGPKGTFAFRGVEPGRYLLDADMRQQNADGPPKSFNAQAIIDVGSSDVNDIELPLSPAAELEVALHSATYVASRSSRALSPAAELEVALHGPEGKKMEPDAVTIGLWLTGSGRRELRWAEAQPNLSFRFFLLPPGSYWILTRTKEPFCAVSAKLGGEDVLHEVVTITPGMAARLDVTASDHCGVIKGRVVSGEKPVPDAKMLLLLSGSAANPGDLITDYADDRGEFSFTGLAPGRYQLWSWSVDESGYFAGPAGLADQEPRATTVVLGEPGTATVDVELLKPEGQRQ